MPPTTTLTRGRDELTAKQKAAVYLFTTAALLVFCLSIRAFMVPLSKGNFVLRELAFFWCTSTLVLIPINPYTFVVFVYHFLSGELLVSFVFGELCPMVFGIILR